MKKSMFVAGFISAIVVLVGILWADHYFGGTITVIMKGLLPK